MKTKQRKICVDVYLLQNNLFKKDYTKRTFRKSMFI